MTKFHQSKAWGKLAKAHKALVCSDCGSTKDIQSGHILPASRFKASRLWMINLKYQCQPCNTKQGAKLRCDLLTLKLLIIYGAVLILKTLIIVIVISLAARFIYLDINRGPIDTTITNQVWMDIQELASSISSEVQ